MSNITYILSQIFIIIGYIFLALSYQIKDRKNILIFNFVTLIAMGLSYVFLSAYSGLAMIFVQLIRNIIFLVDEKKNGKSEKHTKKDYIILAVLFIISIVFGVLTYDGTLSMLPVVATGN